MRIDTTVCQPITGTVETGRWAIPASIPSPLASDDRQALIDQIQSLLDRHVPGRPFPAFFRWACSERNPSQAAWFDLSGIDENTSLRTDLLSGMAEKAQVEQIMRQTLPMAAYQVLDDLSDNLAGSVSSALLAASNSATTRCLAAEECHAAGLLKDVEGLASEASLFRASRDAGRYRTIAGQYVQATGATGAGPVEAIDGDLWSLLVAKAESCREIALSVGNRQLGPMVTQGLTDRVERGESARANGSIPVSGMLMADYRSSRALPVLAFYLAALDSVLGFETLRAQQADETFLEVFSVAAMLVRLLKDVGTPLLTDDWVRARFAHLLSQKTAPRRGEGLGSILLQESQSWGDWLARISPGVISGDTNICLSGLLNLPPSVAIPRFCDRINYLAGMYTNGRKYLDRLTQDITVQVWSELPAKLVLRFVEFHERMCARVLGEITQQNRAVS